MNARTIALILLFVAAVTGGVNPIFIKKALSQIPVFSFTFLRFFISLLLILPLFLKEKPTIGKSFYKILLLSLLSVLNVTLFAFGIKLTTATIGSILYTAVPILALVLSYMILKEKISGNKVFGVGLGFVGTLLIVLLPLVGKASPFKGDLLGNFLILVAVLSFSLYTVLSKHFQKTYSPIYITTIFIFTASVVSFILSLFDIASFGSWWKNVSYEGAFSVFFVSIIGTVLYYIIYQYIIKNTTPLIASTVSYLQPVATFVLAFVLLSERLTLEFIIGAVLVFAGTWFTTKRRQS